jgi:hypothetical protein
LCSDNISCIEPEANQHVVIGKQFHKYYFDLFSSNTEECRPKVNVTMSQPHIQLLAENKVAIVSYIKLTQMGTETVQQSETRVWEKFGEGEWKNIHFHKSPTSK